MYQLWNICGLWHSWNLNLHFLPLWNTYGTIRKSLKELGRWQHFQHSCNGLLKSNMRLQKRTCWSTYVYGRTAETGHKSFDQSVLRWIKHLIINCPLYITTVQYFFNLKNVVTSNVPDFPFSVSQRDKWKRLSFPDFIQLFRSLSSRRRSTISPVWHKPINSSYPFLSFTDNTNIRDPWLFCLTSIPETMCNYF